MKVLYSIIFLVCLSTQIVCADENVFFLEAGGGIMAPSVSLFNEGGMGKGVFSFVEVEENITKKYGISFSYETNSILLVSAGIMITNDDDTFLIPLRLGLHTVTDGGTYFSFAVRRFLLSSSDGMFSETMPTVAIGRVF